MKKILVPLFLLFTFFATAQFNQNAPWMQELEKEKEKNGLTARTQEKDYTLKEISEAFDKYWETHDADKKGSGFKPFMRWKSYWENQVNSDGTLPTGFDVWQSFLNKQNFTGRSNPTSNWTSVGPFSHGSLNRRTTGQGRVNAVAVDPNNANIWYVGAPAGGVWKSTNAGTTWVNLFDDFLQIGVSGIAIDPNDSNTIYIATGDDDAADSYSIGAFKSTDGGSTWNITGLVPEAGSVSFLMNEITIDPTNSNIIWAGTTDGLQKSEDAGATWTIVQPGKISDFKLKPGDPQTVYAVNNFQFFYTTDGGDSFATTTSDLPIASGRLALGVTPANPELVYVVSANTLTSNYTYQGLFKSTDSGVTFTKTANNVDIFESSQAWFDLAIEVNPADEDEVYIGVLNIWKTTDGGDTFTQLNQWFSQTPSFTHADIHTLKFFNGNLFCGSDGGIYMSTDEGNTFTDYTAGIAISQFYRISVAQNDAGKMAGGLQDNSGFIRNDGMWNIFTGADGMDYEIDPTNNNLVYGFIQFGDRLYISNNSGEGVGVVGTPTGVSGNWITPLTVNSVGEVFAGFDGVYKLNGNAWQFLSNVGESNLEEIVIDPNNDDIMYAIDEENIFRSTDRGNSFSLLTSFDSSISDVAVNSLDSNILYVTTSNRVGIELSRQQSLRGVFKLTIDGTNETIEEITGNLPTDQAYFAIVHQGRNSTNPVYVGTNIGVYRIDDTLTEWEEYDTGFPSTSVSDLEISLDAGLITASTYGRGVWQSPLPIQEVEDELRIVSISPESNAVFCNGTLPEITVQNEGKNPVTSINVSYSINGGEPESFDWTGNLGPDQTVTIPFPSFAISEIAPIEFIVTATYSEDTYTDNNTLKTFFIMNESGNIGDVYTFESDSELDLTAYNEVGATQVLWERGVPSGTLLNTASSGTQVYGTNLDGNHPDGTKSILLSKCYDLSNVLAPKLEFNMAYDLEINFDVTYVEYSTNNGASWILLGSPNSQPNWYNSDRTTEDSGDIDCQVCPGGQWTGTEAEMQLYSYDFQLNAAQGETDLTQENNILFRIVFESDPSLNQEGVIIDDFAISGFEDDEDDDNDGINDANDNCPLTANADQANNDGDSEGDICDPDDDNDGVFDIDDNCPFAANADQADFDNDGIGDVCDDDIDNDGVPNNLDNCPTTPIDAVVDANGCAVFSLPTNNFSILSTSETCITNNDGAISISAVEDFNYTATITSGDVNISNTFTDEISFSDLEAGTYKLCITLAENADYEKCFDISVSEPDALSVSSKVSNLESKVDIELSGGNTYFITLNNEVFVTTESQISLPLKLTENKLSITTEQFCQGEYKETILLNDEVLIYPNPIEGGDLTILLGAISDEEVEINLFGTNGASSILKKSFVVQNGTVQFNVDALSKGIYILNIKTEGALLTYKIIRK